MFYAVGDNEPVLVKVNGLTCCSQVQPITPPPLHQLFHTHSLPGASSHRALTSSTRLQTDYLSRLLSLILESARSLSTCGPPGRPLSRLRPHSEPRPWLLTKLPGCRPFGHGNILNKVLNFAAVDLY